MSFLSWHLNTDVNKSDVPLSTMLWVKMSAYPDTCCSSLRYLKKGPVVFVFQNCFAFEKADGQITFHSLFTWLCCLRWLVTGLWLGSHRFNPRSAHMGFMTNKVVLVQIFPWALQFFPTSTIPLILQFYSLCVTNAI
jgi:hypothetical protein